MSSKREFQKKKEKNELQKGVANVRTPTPAAPFHARRHARVNLHAFHSDTARPLCFPRPHAHGAVHPYLHPLCFLRPSHARRPSSSRFTRSGPPMPRPPPTTASHAHALCPQQLQQAGPVACATPDLLLQH
jgi:hypothetical protein